MAPLIGCFLFTFTRESNNQSEDSTRISVELHHTQKKLGEELSAVRETDCLHKLALAVTLSSKN